MREVSVDKFYRITNVRRSLCKGVLVADSLEGCLEHCRGGPVPDLDVFAPDGDSEMPRGYRPLSGQYFQGHQVYERVQ